MTEPKENKSRDEVQRPIDSAKAQSSAKVSRESVADEQELCLNMGDGTEVTAQGLREAGEPSGWSQTAEARGADGRLHFQNPNLPPGQDLAGAMKEWLVNDAPHLPGDLAKNTINGAWALIEPVLKSVNEYLQQKPDMTYMEFAPEIAPMFVAAYMCDRLETLENYNKAHSDKQIPLCVRFTLRVCIGQHGLVHTNKKPGGGGASGCIA